MLHAQVDLAEKGYELYRPLSEHSAADLIAFKDGRFLRIQVKYRAAKNGLLYIAFRSVWADRHGVHTVNIDKREVDLYCVYCPDTRRCYYVDPKRFGGCVYLRIVPVSNGQRKGVWLAEDFEDIPAHFVGDLSPIEAPRIVATKRS